MEKGFDLSNPDELMHHIDITLHGADKSKKKANLWAYIAAHAHTIDYDYKKVLHFIEFVNAYQLMHFHSDKWMNLPSPDPIEYLEIMEFTAHSLQEAGNGTKGEWNWPADWGHVTWNSQVMSSVPKRWNEPRGGGGDVVGALRQVEEAMLLHKKNYGHRELLQLSATEKLLISELLNLFIPTFEEVPPLPPIYLSLDKPRECKSRNADNITLWDTDDLLGVYLPGKSCEIVIFERGLRDCSRSLNLPKLSLRELTIVHEVAHWAADQMPLNRSRSISNHQRWSDLRYHTSAGTTKCDPSGFEETEKEVHEGWAQLICFYTLLMTYDDRLRNSVSPPSLSSYAKRHGRGCLFAFMELNEHQSRPYQVWKDILAHNKTPQQVIGTLKQLRNATPGATMSQWKSIIAAL